MPIYLVNLLTEFLTIYLIKFFKKRLLNNNYYNSNLTMQAIYNVKVSKLIFYSDFITFKSLLDFSLCFPNLVSYALGTLSLINSTIAMFIYLIYFLVLGSMYLYVDKTNKIYIKPFLRKIFFYKHFTVSFGEKERAKLFEEYLLDQSDESTIMGNTYLLPLDRPIYEMENNTEKEMKEYHPTNFYLVYKLLQQYYLINKKKIQDIEKSYQEDFNTNSNEYLNIINEMSKNIDITSNNALNPREERNFYNEFNDLYINVIESDAESTSSINSHISKQKKETNLKLISMFSERYSLVYPYFNLSVSQIISSLNPRSNSDISRECYDEKCNNLMHNCYYTHDKLLMFEIYDNEYLNSFLPNNKISDFSDEYMKYIYENYSKKNNKITIPNILGIFQIKYYDYNKIVVLYKNPKFFINDLQIDNSTLIVLSEGDTIIQRDEQKKEAVNNESLKDSVQIQKKDLILIDDILIRDSNFIINTKISSFYKLNVFYFQESNNNLKINNDEDNENENVNIINNFGVFDVKIGNGSIIKFNIFYSELFRTQIEPSMKNILSGEGNNIQTYSKFLRHQLLSIIQSKDEK